MSSIREAVIEIIYDVCKPERPDLSDPARPLIGSEIDSLDFASVLMAIEDKYDITVSEKDMEGLGSLGALVAYVEKTSKH